MGIPAFLIDPQFDELVSVTDVQEIMDAMTTFPVTKSGWTEPSGDRFKTPLDADGRFFEVLLTRISAVILEIQIFDDQGRTPNGVNNFRFDLVAGSTITFFYTGKYLYVVQYAGPTAYFFCTLLSLSPELETAHDSYTVCGADLIDTGATANVTTDRMFQIINGVFGNESGVTLNPTCRGGDDAIFTRHVSGAIKAYPVTNLGDDGATQNVRGKFFNGIVLHDDDTPVGGERSIPIGEGILGVFKALPMDEEPDTRILIRKS